MGLIDYLDKQREFSDQKKLRKLAMESWIIMVICLFSGFFLMFFFIELGIFALFLSLIAAINQRFMDLAWRIENVR